MKISLNWLSDFVDINVSVETLCEKLVSAGFEVEEIIDLSANMKNVVVGRIDGLTKHPDADKLQVCAINVGNETVQIVTGASNIAVGDFVPVALDNSLLPNGTKIKKGKLRGVDSFGMLCSGSELCLKEADYTGAEADGIMILKEKYTLGLDMNEVLGNCDTVLDVSVTANRPDCNSVIGIAREVATVLNIPFKMPNLSFSTNTSIKIDNLVNIEVLDTELCPRYMASVVTDIKVKKSPAYIANRLKAVGLRPINNFVDITNYVLIEMGQPLHAFDYTKLSGAKIVVDKARDGEAFTTLDAKKHTLDETMLTIRDGEKPCAIAGVMGGEFSGVTAATSQILFESAKFLRDNIRRTSRKLNLRTDASTRYERGIDFASQDLGLRRALALVCELKCGNIIDGIIDCVNGSLNEKVISTTTDRINEILGVEVSGEKMVEILNNLQIKTKLNGKVIVCIIPLYREDIENANDLAEEVIRLYGYDNIIARPIDVGVNTLGGKSKSQKAVDLVKDTLIANGMFETLTYSFTSPKVFDLLHLCEADVRRNAIKLLNPLGEDLSVMRTTLAYSMINTLSTNILKNNKAGRFFEIANVYLPKQMPVNEQPIEKETVVFGVYGENESFYTIKGIVENVLERFCIVATYERHCSAYMHPGRSANIIVNGKIIGYFGEVLSSIVDKIDNRIFIAEIDFNELFGVSARTFKFLEIAKFPPMERDIAVIVSEDITAQQIIDCIKEAGGSLLKEADIFDIYRGGQVPQGQKSVAINMMFRQNDRTLTDEEVSTKVAKILKNLEVKISAQLR